MTPPCAIVPPGSGVHLPCLLNLHCPAMVPGREGWEGSHRTSLRTWLRDTRPANSTQTAKHVHVSQELRGDEYKVLTVADSVYVENHPSYGDVLSLTPGIHITKCVHPGDRTGSLTISYPGPSRSHSQRDARERVLAEEPGPKTESLLCRKLV